MRKEVKKTVYVERLFTINTEEFVVVKTVNTLSPAVNTYVPKDALNDLIDRGVQVVVTSRKRGK